MEKCHLIFRGVSDIDPAKGERNVSCYTGIANCQKRKRKEEKKSFGKGGYSTLFVSPYLIVIGNESMTIFPKPILYNSTSNYEKEEEKEKEEKNLLQKSLF